MKSNKLIIAILVSVLFVPILTTKGVPVTDNVMISPDDFDSDVGAIPGQTIKYTIDELTLPEIDLGEEYPPIEISNLTGNTIYVKVLQVEEDIILDYLDSMTGTLIHFGLGLLLTQDLTLTIGEGYAAINMILPMGCATPAITMSGVPHFNTSWLMYEPAFFFMNDDWSEHEAVLTYYGFSVTNGVDEFSASVTDGDGSASLTWRKSDGILTHLEINDIDFMGFNFEGGVLEFSLASVDLIGLNIQVGQEITLNADIAKLDISGTGDYYSQVESDASELETDIELMKDNEILKFSIEEINGLFYTATVYAYNMETQALDNLGPVQYCGFLGAIGGGLPLASSLSAEEPGTSLSDNQLLMLILASAPAVTPDWDIYTGYMLLANTIIGVYLDDLLNLLTGELGYDINSIGGTFGLSSEKGYNTLYGSLNLDVHLELEEGGLSGYTAATSLTVLADIIANFEGWVSYSDTGILAGVRIKGDINVEISTSFGRPDTTTPEVPTGTVLIEFDIKLRNPEENPPDTLGGGIIPGFTWLVAIPALIGLAAIGLIIRKRK